ncbi:alpha/beta-hydrolase [Diplogelasinospora grovesii]|uniref:Carboxylic ester hydrolase n=1 Tax=Diplogelasinospora grovesii TaxID=303347 RepID=A0AAN6N317_9PEZI|nr:alpha/beta-hydrolase [Diplogelasinospora grovesii]
MKDLFLGTALALFGLVAAAPAPRPLPPSPVLEERVANPTVTMSSGGSVVGTSNSVTEAFNGIPFASPPTGQLRLKPPVKRNSSTLAAFDATGQAAACPQFFVSTGSNDLISEILSTVVDLPFFQTVTDQNEDCLNLNVVRPAGTTAGDNLPVLFWIFGGAFELGWTSMYDPTSLVASAVAMGKPYVFVAVNYRVGGFGFMPGKEILADGSSNLGLLDQRMGLEWVADNIASFGGDPSKVTIWGESAGAMSVFDQMALYGGNNKYNGQPLFRGGIMDSGSIVPADPVDCPKGQAVYNTVVAKAGCSAASDTLACLRGVDYQTFLNAANSVPALLSYSSVALSYLPRPDGNVLTDSPEVLVKNGQYAAVPMIIGDQEDEGTLFSLFQANTTSTTSDLVDYLSTIFFHDATEAQLTELVDTYDSSLTAGSPFRTGIFNEIYPGFKRLAAILGDLVFTLTRRAFLAEAVTLNPSVPAWSYLASYDYGTPILGTFHATDLLRVFYGLLPNYASKSIQSYYANFVYNLDPNDASGGTSVGSSAVAMQWPLWASNNQLMQFFNNGASLLADDFRSTSYDWIVSNVASLHV